MAKTKSLASGCECVSPIEHDGERIDIGGDISTLPDDAVRTLLASGALRALAEPAPPPAAPAPPPAP
ncbi:MAG: hypothetical protein RJA99_4292 [Pseudomonadota bacterium]|jgi:hypothetical protein